MMEEDLTLGGGHTGNIQILYQNFTPETYEPIHQCHPNKFNIKKTQKYQYILSSPHIVLVGTNLSLSIKMVILHL